MQLSNGDAAGPVEYDRILKIIQQSKDDLVNVGYSEFAVEDFHEVSSCAAMLNSLSPSTSFSSIEHIQSYTLIFIIFLCFTADFLGLLFARAKLVACGIVRTLHRRRRG